MSAVHAGRTPRAAPRHALETLAPGCSALLWVLPLVYAVWTAFHPAEFSTRFDLARAADAGELPPAPGTRRRSPRYFLNTVAAGDDDPGRAARAGARWPPTRSRASSSRAATSLFALVLVQLMMMPDVLIVENYRTMSALGLLDTILAIGLPYMASAPSASSCCGRPSRRCRSELDDAARVEGCGPLQVLLEGLRAAGAADLPRLRAGLGQLSLEQLPVAADRHQLGRDAAADGRPAGVLVDRPGHRLVDHHARRR